MTSIAEILETKCATSEDARKLFDELPPVDIDFMTGRWKGSEISTGHDMDGLLDVTGWYGKMFINKEEVHPLLFFSNENTELYAVNPRYIPFDIDFPKSNSLRTLLRLSKPLLQTKKSKARLRMIEYRGKTTATMAYDDKAIFDHFAKIDNDTVIGCMDLKNVSQPYFFLLERDDLTRYKLDF